jgi:hypothetical protein
VSLVRTALLVLAASASVSPASDAAAGPDREFKTHLTIRQDGDVFRGRVKSDKARCERFVRVELVRKRTGTDAGTGFDDKSGPNGRWTIEYGSYNPGARYYAVVDGSRRNGRRGQFDCLRGQSKAVRAVG